MWNDNLAVRETVQFQAPRVLENLLSDLRTLSKSPARDYLLEEVMSKYVSEETDPAVIRRSRAIAKWLACEEDNRLTNERLFLTPLEYQILPRVPFGEFMQFTRDTILRILGGDTVPVDALIGAFSGGASTSRSRANSHPAGKHVGRSDITARAMPWYSTLVEECPGWPIPTPTLVSGNVLFTVPKKTDIDRVACKEPDINMFLQKGAGSHIERGLLAEGVNLRDQSRNRSLARIGSLDDSLATLDLSSASDSVTYELVQQLLPDMWFDFLDSIRSEWTTIDGELHRNEMFSSMGNGFTFQLESMLFYAVARSVAYFTGTRGIISVYGDDIICPSGMYDNLVWVLGYLGFKVNTKKSFASGPFRESCGGHYWNGVDITPFYVRKPLSELTDLIHLANSLRAWAARPDYGVLDPEVYPIWEKLRDLVPRRLWGGRDTADKTRLVTDHVGTHRIVFDRKQYSTGDGGYYHWLSSTWHREKGSSIQTSSATRETGQWRIRRLPRHTEPQLGNLFFEEIVGPSDRNTY